MTPPSQSRDGTAIAIPTVKQHLASLRMLFDWLITGQAIDKVKSGLIVLAFCGAHVRRDFLTRPPSTHRR